MLSSRILTSLGSYSYHSSPPFPAPAAASIRPPPCRCSLRGLPDLSSSHSLNPHASDPLSRLQSNNFFPFGGGGSRGQDGDPEEERRGISIIQVERHKYIPVSKAELRDAIVSALLPTKDEARQFHLLTSCVDSILHAEHKSVLEEMRSDYSISQSEKTGGSFQADKDSETLANNKGLHSTKNGQTEIRCTEEQGENVEDTYQMIFSYGLDLISILNSSIKNGKRYINGDSRVAVDTRFQRAFMKLLKDAQFEELSERDLMLTSALNTDYLLTLPIYVDWKRASESNAIIFRQPILYTRTDIMRYNAHLCLISDTEQVRFGPICAGIISHEVYDMLQCSYRRGYTTETQKGLLIVEKLDYLQSKLLQGLFFIISKPLGKLGSWITEAFKNAHWTEETQEQLKRLRLWLKEISIIQKSFHYKEQSPGDLVEEDKISNSDLPIWLAAQSAVTRYEGILSSIGPRGRLLRRLLSWSGLLPPAPEKPFTLDNDSKDSEPYLRPSFLSRISISDIWRPASKKYCGNDIWKRFKTSVSLLLSQSVLQEPAFKELILLYTKEVHEGDAENKVGIPSLQLKIYKRIPIPDLPVIFPDKKLSFRIIDTVRLDTATVFGLLAFFINYKFENVLSSPSAIFLDAVAISALIVYVIRVGLGYKQTWDRYQLLVNKTLYEKTLASGFGSVHFLLDASEQQQYKEAVLAYAILLKEGKDEGMCERSIEDRCERFMYDVLKVKVKMAGEEALETLRRLGLASGVMGVEGRIIWKATPSYEACEALKLRWNTLLA